LPQSVGNYAVGVGKHEQAEETLEITLPEQAEAAYGLTSETSLTKNMVKSPQNSWDSSRRPGTLVERSARRQLSALQPRGWRYMFHISNMRFV